MLRRGRSRSTDLLPLWLQVERHEEWGGQGHRRRSLSGQERQCTRVETVAYAGPFSDRTVRGIQPREGRDIETVTVLVLVGCVVKIESQARVETEGEHGGWVP